MIQSCHQAQYVNETCRLQTFTFSCVDGIAENDDHSVEKEHIGKISRDSWQDVVHNETEDTESYIVVDTDVCVIQGH